jgi:hypothetical protein
MLGCRINRGAHGDGLPNDGFYRQAAGAGRDAALQGAMMDVSSSGNAAPASVPSPNPALIVDAGSSGSASTPDDAGPFGTLPASVDGGGLAAGAQSCGQSAKSAVCDPIGNTGCLHELGMQCDVDLFATTLSGVCVFSAPNPDPDAGTCLNIAPTENCPPGQTCVDGTQCSTVCLCDADCATGSCCRKPIGKGGFKVCGPC